MQGAPGAAQSHGARGQEFIPNHCPGVLGGGGSQHLQHLLFTE